MPFTHVEVEERVTRRIVVLFATLTLLYGASITALVIGTRLLLGLAVSVSVRQIGAILGAALFGAAIHGAVSIGRLVERVLLAIRACPLDPGDTYHDRLKRIVEEVMIATGGRRQIEPYVIPTHAMNACAVSDFSGRSAIAVTEGALARLNRAQLEAVVGHEAAHIASGDSLSNSVFCGLFGLHEEGLKRLSGLFSGRTGTELLRGRAGLVALFVIVILWITSQVKRFCELAISRQQEYRADAVAVRLTRDPLSLAEALHLISKHWRGMGAQGESLANIFILDPGTDVLSERDGPTADLFSTHPPTTRRIALLLGMAHLTPAQFEEGLAASLEHKRARRKPAPATVDAQSAQWMVWRQGSWIGPLGLGALANAEDLVPDSWVRRLGEPFAQPAHQDPQLLEALRNRYAGAHENPSRTECPNCRVGLVAVLYEGAPIDTCPACRGCYVDSTTVRKVLCREERDFPDSVKRLGDLLLSPEGQVRFRSRLALTSKGARGSRGMPVAPLENRRCRRCGAGVVRKFYTEAYPVDVEQCWICGLAWLDHQELELLQYLYEKRQTQGIAPTGPF